MTDTVERAARAMHIAEVEYWDDRWKDVPINLKVRQPTWEELTQRFRDEYLLQAAAALARLDCPECAAKAMHAAMSKYERGEIQGMEPPCYFQELKMGCTAWDDLRPETRESYIRQAKAALVALTSLAAERAAEDNMSKYDNEMFNEGVTHSVELLAKSIGATGWYAGDGSEDYDCDLAQTFLNILAAKGLYDEDDGRFATLASVKSVPNGWQLVPKEPTEAMLESGRKAYFGARAYSDTTPDQAQRLDYLAMLAAAPTPPVQPVSDESLTMSMFGSRADLEAAKEKRADEPAPQAYGIIDPDYARVFTIARCIAWSEGYALVMHGSFTRDLDLLAVPWTEGATEAEHLVRRIASSLDDLDILVKTPAADTQATEKPHGRMAWTLTFKAFGDPRFVDLSVMPRVPHALPQSAKEVVEALAKAREALEIIAGKRQCVDNLMSNVDVANAAIASLSQEQG